MKLIHFIDEVKLNLYPRVRHSTTHLTLDPFQTEIGHSVNLKIGIILERIIQFTFNFREADDQFAQDMIRFDYHDIHDETDPDSEEECPYCQIKKNQPLNELLKNNLAIRAGKRRRRDRNDSSYESGSNLG